MNELIITHILSSSSSYSYPSFPTLVLWKAKSYPPFKAHASTPYSLPYSVWYHLDFIKSMEVIDKI